MLLEKLWEWLWGHKLTYALTFSLWIAVCWVALPWVLPCFGEVNASPVVYWMMLPAFFGFSSMGAYYTDKLDRSKLRPDIREGVFQMRQLCYRIQESGPLIGQESASKTRGEVHKFYQCCVDSRMTESFCSVFICADLLEEEFGKEEVDAKTVLFLNGHLQKGAEKFIKASEWATKS